MNIIEDVAGLVNLEVIHASTEFFTPWLKSVIGCVWSITPIGLRNRISIGSNNPSDFTASAIRTRWEAQRSTNFSPNWLPRKRLMQIPKTRGWRSEESAPGNLQPEDPSQDRLRMIKNWREPKINLSLLYGYTESGEPHKKGSGHPYARQDQIASQIHSQWREKGQMQAPHLFLGCHVECYDFVKSLRWIER